jgi:AcrR family transcriptional regulator
MPSSDAHVKPPKQSRSRRTLERIVRASLEILGEEGADALTVQAIVKRAGSSVGSFYARFDGKEDLLDYLGERMWKEAAERWDQSLAEKNWQEVELRQLVEGSVRLLAETARSRLSHFQALDRSTGAQNDAYGHFRGHILQGIEGLLLARLMEIQHPQPPLAVHLGLVAALALLEEPDSTLVEGLPVPREQRIQETVTLLMSYFGGETGGEGGTPDFFDIWG